MLQNEAKKRMLETSMKQVEEEDVAIEEIERIFGDTMKVECAYRNR